MIEPLIQASPEILEIFSDRIIIDEENTFKLCVEGTKRCFRCGLKVYVRAQCKKKYMGDKIPISANTKPHNK